MQYYQYRELKTLMEFSPASSCFLNSVAMATKENLREQRNTMKKISTGMNNLASILSTNLSSNLIFFFIALAYILPLPTVGGASGV